MHLAPVDRPRAFRKLGTLLKPGGVLILTLRGGPSESERAMHPTSLGEIEALAREHGLAILRALDEPDRLSRAGVAWTSVVLRLLDDGSLSLPASIRYASGRRRSVGGPDRAAETHG